MDYVLKSHIIDMINESLKTDFTTCADTTKINDKYAYCYNKMAKIITEGLSLSYQSSNFLVIVGESFDFYNHNSIQTQVLYKVGNLHFLVLKF